MTGVSSVYLLLALCDGGVDFWPIRGELADRAEDGGAVGRILSQRHTNRQHPSTQCNSN